MNEIDKRIANRLKRARNELNLSQQKACELTGLSLHVLRGAEDATRPMKSSELFKLCDLYLRDSWDFMCPDPMPPRQKSYTWKRHMEKQNRLTIEQCKNLEKWGLPQDKYNAKIGEWWYYGTGDSFERVLIDYASTVWFSPRTKVYKIPTLDELLEFAEVLGQARLKERFNGIILCSDIGYINSGARGKCSSFYWEKHDMDILCDGNPDSVHMGDSMGKRQSVYMLIESVINESQKD